MGNDTAECYEGLSCDEIQFEVQQHTVDFKGGRITMAEYNERTRPLVERYRVIMNPPVQQDFHEPPEESGITTKSGRGFDDIILEMLSA